MRVVIGAYACEPLRGSEPGVGWNWSLAAAASGHEIHVVTRENNRAAIERHAFSIPGNLYFHYFDLPRPLLMVKRRGGYCGLIAYYYLWQIRLGFFARRMHNEEPFQIAHHVTFVNDWLPSGLALLPSKFVWGPIGGSTHTIPRQFLSLLSPKAKRYELFRYLVQKIAKWTDPLSWLTRWRADIALVYTNEALEGLPPPTRKKARSIVHIGVEASQLPAEQKLPPLRGKQGLRISSGGRLVHWKGFDLLVRACSEAIQSRGTPLTLSITGAGPFRERLEALASELGIDEHVQFRGNLTTWSEVLNDVLRSHLYCLPTLRDGPPTAILEAMALGRPVACLKLGAPGELVPPEAGYLIEARSAVQVVSDLAALFSRLQDSPEELEEKGRAARKHALHRHSWSRIQEEVRTVYSSLVP